MLFRRELTISNNNIVFFNGLYKKKSKIEDVVKIKKEKRYDFLGREHVLHIALDKKDKTLFYFEESWKNTKDLKLIIVKNNIPYI